MLIDLASFPNSRIKPRPVTEQSVQGQITVPANTPTLVRAANPNRVNLTIYNQSLTGTLRYMTGTTVNIESQGFELGPDRAIDLDDPQSVYVWCDEEIIINFDDSVG